MNAIQEIFQPTPGKPFDVLSFASPDGELWAPDVTGVYRDDCATGRFYARELVGYMRVRNAPMMLGHVIGAIGDRPHSGVEVGFFHELSQILVSGSLVQAA